MVGNIPGGISLIVRSVIPLNLEYTVQHLLIGILKAKALMVAMIWQEMSGNGLILLGMLNISSIVCCVAALGTAPDITLAARITVSPSQTPTGSTPGFVALRTSLKKLHLVLLPFFPLPYRRRRSKFFWSTSTMLIYATIWSQRSTIDVTEFFFHAITKIKNRHFSPLPQGIMYIRKKWKRGKRI